MAMVLKNEDDILSKEFRLDVIKSIGKPYNIKRKNESVKRHDIYRDRTKKYVIENLLSSGLKKEHVMKMAARASNISIAKKVISKLARLYVSGVRRSSDFEPMNDVIATYTDSMNFNVVKKKADRYFELFKNCLVFVGPEFDDREAAYRIVSKVYAPYEYDALVSKYSKENAKAFIFSDFTKDEKDREYVYWSDRYHLTFDGRGDVIASKSPEDLLNPIAINPCVHYSDDRTGSFWADGGEDLVEGSILINTLITDMFSIAYQQGYGQMVVSGKNLDKEMEVGPHTAIFLEQRDGDPTPSVSFQTANPPLESWLRSIEQYTALLLSTNNISPSSVSMSLDSTNFPSGIAMLIEKSEAVADVQDKQELFRDGERREWDLVLRWHNLYQGNLVGELNAVGPLPTDVKVSVAFDEIKPVISEAEKLENLKRRKELGINTAVDLVRLDQPSLTLEQAEEQVAKVREETLAYLADEESPGGQGRI